MTKNIKELFYLVPYLSFVFIKLLSYTMFPIQYGGIFNWLDLTISMLTIGLLIIKIFGERVYSVTTIIFFFTLVPLLLIIGYKSGQLSQFLIFSLVLFGLKQMDFRKILTYHAFVMIAVIFGVFLFVRLGVFANISHAARMGQVIRYYEGYRFPSFGANLVFHLTCIWIYVRAQKLKWLELMLLGFLNYYFFVKTDTKSAFYLSVLLILATVVVKLFKIPIHYQNKLIGWVDKYLILVVSAVSIGLTRIYAQGGEWLVLLNRALTGRLYLGSAALQRYPINLFGQRIEWSVYDLYGQVIGEYLYVDASFLNILLNFGILFFGILVLGFISLGFKNPYRNIYYSLAFATLVLHSMWDPQFLELWFNPFLLFLGVPIFRQDFLNDET